MVQINFENIYEIIIVAIFGLSYFFNMIYYGESSSSKITAIKEAIMGIGKEVHSMALMWKNDTPDIPKPKINTKLDQIYETVSLTRQSIEKIDKRVSTLEEYHQKHGHIND